MADVSQVSLALAFECATLVYPLGLDKASVTGRQTFVRRGWLLPSDVFSAESVRSNVDYITVTSALEDYKGLAEPLGRPWTQDLKIDPTISVSCDDNVATVAFASGGAPCGIVGLRWDSGPIRSATSAYAVSANDTPQSVAAGLAAGFSGAIAVGAQVKVLEGSLTARVAGYGRSRRVTRRQTQKLRLSIWTSSADAREQLGQLLDTSLSEINWLPTADCGQAQLSFEGSGDVDTLQTQTLYRRDLIFRTVFDTFQSEWSAYMMFGVGQLSGPEWEAGFGDALPSLDGQSDLAVLAAEAAATQGVVADCSYPGFTTDAFGTVRSAS